MNPFFVWPWNEWTIYIFCMLHDSHQKSAQNCLRVVSWGWSTCGLNLVILFIFLWLFCCEWMSFPYRLVYQKSNMRLDCIVCRNHGSSFLFLFSCKWYQNVLDGDWFFHFFWLIQMYIPNGLERDFDCSIHAHGILESFLHGMFYGRSALVYRRSECFGICFVYRGSVCLYECWWVFHEKAIRHS